MIHKCKVCTISSALTTNLIQSYTQDKRRQALELPRYGLRYSVKESMMKDNTLAATEHLVVISVVSLPLAFLTHAYEGHATTAPCCYF